MASSSISKPHSRTTSSSSCLCSPTTHPGSFRCSRHRNYNKPSGRGRVVRVSSSSQGVAKANSIKALLLQIIKPSSHDMQRRRNFQPKPSRFCLLNATNNGNPSFGVAVLSG